MPIPSSSLRSFPIILILCIAFAPLPIKVATLIGNGANAMHKIKMIGNDLKLDEGIGTCGKDGQGVPVGVGQPTLLMDGITIGGTNI